MMATEYNGDARVTEVNGMVRIQLPENSYIDMKPSAAVTIAQLMISRAIDIDPNAGSGKIMVMA